MSPPQSPRPSYQKPWLSYADQIALLSSRGLVIANVPAATDFLRHVSYYRFSGYCLAFEVSRHTFRPGVTFEQVQAAYEFDLALRDVVTEALEVVEVDAPTVAVFRKKAGRGRVAYRRMMGRLLDVYAARELSAKGD